MANLLDFVQRARHYGIASGPSNFHRLALGEYRLAYEKHMVVVSVQQHLEKNMKPRIAHLNPPYTPDVHKALYATASKDSKVEPLKLWRVMAKNPALSAAMHSMGMFMIQRNADVVASYDLRTREIIIDRVTARCGCEYEWGVHIALYAEKAQLTEEHIYSIVHGTATDPCWQPRDAALIAMVDALHDTGNLDDAAWENLQQFFDEKVILELLVLSAWYHVFGYLANVAQTENEDWARRFPGKI